MENIRMGTRRLTMLAMLLAMAVALSALEHMLPPLPLLPPNVRLGLSNIVTMYTLFFLGKGEAATLVVIKSGFVLLTRGATAGVMSLCGGLSAIGVIALLCLLSRNKIGYLLLSVAGAVFHNIGQIIAASLLLRTNVWLATLPLLVLFGILAGSVTGTLLRVVMPLFDRILQSERNKP